MRRSSALFLVLFVLLPLAGLGGAMLLSGGAAVLLAAGAMALLLFGFTVALAFVDLER